MRSADSSLGGQRRNKVDKSETRLEHLSKETDNEGKVVRDVRDPGVSRHGDTREPWNVIVGISCGQVGVNHATWTPVPNRVDTSMSIKSPWIGATRFMQVAIDRVEPRESDACELMSISVEGQNEGEKMKISWNNNKVLTTLFCTFYTSIKRKFVLPRGIARTSFSFPFFLTLDGQFWI